MAREQEHCLGIHLPHRNCLKECDTGRCDSPSIRATVGDSCAPYCSPRKTLEHPEQKAFSRNRKPVPLPRLSSSRATAIPPVCLIHNSQRKYFGWLLLCQCFGLRLRSAGLCVPLIPSSGSRNADVAEIGNQQTVLTGGVPLEPDRNARKIQGAINSDRGCLLERRLKRPIRAFPATLVLYAASPRR